MLEVISHILALALLALPILLSVFLIVKSQHNPMVWLASGVATSGCCYILLMAAVQTTNLHLRIERDKFDLDDDGMFSGNEITPEAERAMSAVSNDTGRTLAPITGIFTCPIYSFFWHGLFGTFYFFQRILRKQIQNQ